MQCPVCIKLTYIMYIYIFAALYLECELTSAKCATQVYRGKVRSDKMCDKKKL